MTPSPQPAPRMLSTGFGVLMVGAAALFAEGVELLGAAAATVAIAVGLIYRAAAVVAVVVTVGLVAVSAAPPLLAALSGMAAAAYLVVRHAAGPAGGVTVTWPTSLAIVGFTFVGVVATSVPLQVAWLPLLAPPAALAMYLISVRTFVTGNGAESTGRG